MLGLYLDTLIIGYKLCSMLSILNELTLLKELHTCNFMAKNVFRTKITLHQQHNKKANIKSIARELYPGPLALQS